MQSFNRLVTPADRLICSVLEGKIPDPSKPPRPASAPHIYASHRDTFPPRKLTDTERTARNISKRLKTGTDIDATLQAGDDMAHLVPPRSVLVPVPGHTGDTSANRRLADYLSKKTGAEVADVLTRSEVAPSSMKTRLATGRALKVDQHNMTTREPFNPDHDKSVLFIDNTVTSGSTIAAARKALGGRGHGLAFSRAPERKNKKFTEEKTR